jgi:hypothetical protein
MSTTASGRSDYIYTNTILYSVCVYIYIHIYYLVQKGDVSGDGREGDRAPRASRDLLRSFHASVSVPTDVDVRRVINRRSRLPEIPMIYIVYITMPFPTYKRA